MNVSELSRRFNMRTEELLNILPEFGFDVGKRAIKIDDRVAQNIVREWPRIQRELLRRKVEIEKKRRAEEKQMRQSANQEVVIPEILTVREFGLALQLPITTLMRELMKNGILAALNDRIDYDTATVIAEDLGFVVKKQTAKIQDDAKPIEHETALKEALEGEIEENLIERPAVIVVMGHVDHGKTKLLDAIRSTNIIATEAGGITQHIGAYQVEKQGHKITFIDTPGHEAFTVMRSRGARVADIAILVVAADDGVMPQTKEAINIIRAAKLPMIVALNKIDKPEANQDKVKTQLSEAGVIIEEWGGDVPIVPISAKDGRNIDKILEVLLLVADVNKDKIRANPNRAAIGTIIDSRVDKGEGPVATVLVQAGTLNARDPLVVNGRLYGRVRAMKNFLGKDVSVAMPGTPVKILGFESAPEVGDILDVASVGSAEVMKKTKTLKSHVMANIVQTQNVDIETEEGTGKKLLPVLIKADTLGSLEAILQSIEQIQHQEVGVQIVARGLGNITEAEILKAESAGTLLYAFHVVTTPSAASLAHQKNIQIRTFNVIYDLFTDIKAELEKLLEPEIITTVYGRAKVIKIFRQDKKVQIIGCRLDNGSLIQDISAKIFRGDQELGEGKIKTLKSGKSEVKEIHSGQEFGVEFHSRTTLLENDILEGYKTEKKQRKLKI